MSVVCQALRQWNVTMSKTQSLHSENIQSIRKYRSGWAIVKLYVKCFNKKAMVHHGRLAGGKEKHQLDMGRLGRFPGRSGISNESFAESTLWERENSAFRKGADLSVSLTAFKTNYLLLKTPFALLCFHLSCCLWASWYRR